jgi:Leucine-rich repeat (LRR) protein
VLLDLGSNQLDGTIPTTLGLIPELAGLSVYGNALTGSIPSELVGLVNLQLLYLDSTDLRGPLPAGLCDLALQEFWGDCEETQCLCCTTCCSDGFGCI